MDMAGPWTIGVIAALSQEIRGAIRRFKLQPDTGRYSGQVGVCPVVAAISGIGTQRACACLDRLLASCRPRWMVSIGFAGALDPSLVAGDLVVAGAIRNDQGAILRTDLLAETPGAWRRATLLAVDHLVNTPQLKRRLRAAHQAVAVDMESYALVQRARQHGVPISAFRAIVDPAELRVPAAAGQWVKDDGTTDTAAVWRHLAARPWDLSSVVPLAIGARRATAALTEAVAWSCGVLGRRFSDPAACASENPL